MKNQFGSVVVSAFVAGFIMSGPALAKPAMPNIVYILADDMGYGDVHCLNPERGKIPTPHMDQLAADGMIFTDAHSGSSVCTPTRYGIMTGRYSWRTILQKNVLSGHSEPLIPPDRPTVASLLKAQGYNTACIGKWHIGMKLPTKDGRAAAKNLKNVDWSGTVEGGPSDIGFDYHWGIAASLDMPPYIYIENKKFLGECTTTKAFHRGGPAEADFEAVDVLPDIGNKTVEYIQKQRAGKPFFAYVALTSPHTPIAPSSAWKGKSGMGDYADFMMQTDDVIGQMIDAVDAAGLADNTIIIVTSDNGCSRRADFRNLKSHGHYPSAQYRGSKSDIWEGGHRIPFIVRWPKGIKAGTFCDQTICLTDLMATAADLSGAKIPENAGEDSVSFLPAFAGKEIQSTRNGVIHHSIDGHFAYRQGKWKLCLARGSGGWTSPDEKAAAEKGALAAQLYDLEKDPGETTNLYESHPEVAERLLKLLKQDVERGRSTAGAMVKNDVPEIVLWKSGE
ncbi:arylsulfatase [Pontiellaceae bacterium B12219]|nr:arylsulfatase [Pontiellaceae bacterium B12219]